MSETAAAPPGDPLRAELLAAAARVFARQGYAGTKILDIVREAGVSTGAVYGRFRSKNDLLREAVIARSATAGRLGDKEVERVADLIREVAALRTDELSDADAVRLEAFVAARREPEVAEALAEAQGRARTAIQPLIDAAVADGTVGEGIDPEAVLFFVRVMGLGLLLHRGAGLPTPDPAAWEALITRVVASFGRDAETRGDL